MYKIALLAMVMVFAGISPSWASEPCSIPETPQLAANGAIITYEQLNAAAALVSAYSKSNISYKSCLDNIITNPGDHSRTRWRAALVAYNQTVSAEQVVWDAYEKLSSDWRKANQAVAQ